MRESDDKEAFLVRISAFYRHYRTAPLSDWEHMLIRDVLVHSKYYALSVALILGICVYAVRGHISNFWIFLFLAAFVIEAMIKVRIGDHYERLPREQQGAPCWRFIFDAGSLYSGIVYGLASLVVFHPMPDHNRLLLIAAFCALICILTAVTVLLPSVSRWMLPSLVAPIVIALLLSGDTNLWLLALIIVASVVSVSLLGRMSQHRFRHIARLNLENKALVDSLSLQQSYAEKAQEKAERAVIDKSRFLATASHDLRQPLHALGLFHHALRQKSEDESNRKLFESIDKSTAALNNMFDSLLDVSRLDANVVKPEYERVSLESVFDLFSQEFSPIAREKGLFFRCHYPDEIILTDRMLFARILRNLVSNAIKFTDDGGVSVVARSDGCNLSIVVTDTGSGIPEVERKNVFSEFYQLEEDGRHRAAGVGLGLSIVHRLCKLLAIDIELDVAQCGGTEVHLSMAGAVISSEDMSEYQSAVDSRPTANARKADKRLSRAALSGRCILFIDDDADIRDAMSSMLTQWGCEAVCARNAEEGLRQLSALAQKPDVLVCDLHLANGRSGMEAIHLLRDVLGQNLPAMLVSGASGADELLAVENAGFCCLTKPVSPDTLKEAILALMRKHAAMVHAAAVASLIRGEGRSGAAVLRHEK